VAGGQGRGLPPGIDPTQDPSQVCPPPLARDAEGTLLCCYRLSVCLKYAAVLKVLYCVATVCLSVCLSEVCSCAEGIVLCSYRLSVCLSEVCSCAEGIVLCCYRLSVCLKYADVLMTSSNFCSVAECLFFGMSHPSVATACLSEVCRCADDVVQFLQCS
jgi:hypothetical protein